jgi:hypothetical protein
MRFSGFNLDVGKRNGARFGLILVLPLNTPLFTIYEVN